MKLSGFYGLFSSDIFRSFGKTAAPTMLHSQSGEWEDTPTRMSALVGWWQLTVRRGKLISCKFGEWVFSDSVYICFTSMDVLGLGLHVTSTRMSFLARGQREELRPWQRSWGRRLGIRKGVIKPQETPCSRASTPKPVSVLCSHLYLWLYGGLSPITIFSQRRSKRAAPRQ